MGGGGPNYDGFAYVYKDVHGSGTSKSYVTIHENRYLPVRKQDLINSGLYHNISSCNVFQWSSTKELSLILFDNSIFNYDLPDFAGNFLQLTTPVPHFLHSVDHLSTYNFNNKTGNMLIVHSDIDKEFRIPLRGLLLDRWDDITSSLEQHIQVNFASAGIKFPGDPVLTWEMFPDLSYLNSNLTYLKLHQKIKIKLSPWPDYDATVTYHVYLYINHQGELRGYVARWAYWVESGILSSTIAGFIEDAVIDGMTDLNSELTNMLNLVPGNLNDVYYLPGNQAQVSGNPEILSGNTYEDITLVVEFL